jgi:hypothetical protein
MGFRSFLLRCFAPVQGEWTPACIGWNLKRLYALKKAQERGKRHDYAKKTVH